MKRHSQPTRRACAGHPTSCHSPLCWVTLALPALLLFPPACSDDSANDLDAAMDRFVRPDGRPDRLVDAARDRWVLPDGRPDYSIPDSSCIPETLPPEEIEPGLLIRMPPTGEYSMDSLDLSETYVVYAEKRCPFSTSEFADTFLFDLRTMTESLIVSGLRNQSYGYIWNDTIVYMDDTYAWPPFSDDPGNKNRLRLFLYDITTGTSSLLMDGNWFKIPLDFNGRQVLYISSQDIPEDIDEVDTRLYDRVTGEDRILVGYQERSLSGKALSSRYVAWVAESGNAWDVFYHDIEANRTIAMNRVSNYHFLVDLSERYLYWDEGTQFGDYDVWSHDFVTGHDEVLTDPGADQGFARAGVGRAGHLVVFRDYSRSGARYPNPPFDAVLLDRDTGIQRTLTRQPDDVGILRPTCQWIILSRRSPTQYSRAVFYLWNLVEAGVLDDSCHVLPCDQQTEDCTTVQVPPGQ